MLLTLICQKLKLIPPSVNLIEVIRFRIIKMLGYHKNVNWPAHISSVINDPKNITIGNRTYPGKSPGCYIQAMNGICFGNNIRIGPNVSIVSANHDLEDFDKATKQDKIIIGDNCWLGANCVILPGVKLGNHVIVAAGTIVTKNFLEDDIVIAGSPAKIIKKIGKYKGYDYRS